MKDLSNDAIVGAGTPTRPEHSRQAEGAGAVLAMSPGITPMLAAAQGKTELDWLPGIVMSSELILALGFDLATLKFFPVEVVGGIPILKLIYGPFGDVHFYPTGGIMPQNAPDYPMLLNVVCMGGSWMAPKDRVAAGSWTGIMALTKEAAVLEW